MKAFRWMLREEDFKNQPATKAKEDDESMKQAFVINKSSKAKTLFLHFTSISRCWRKTIPKRDY